MEFEQYLRFSDVPVLEYKWNKKELSLRWNAEAKGFRMPLIYTSGEVEKRILVSNSDWTTVSMSKKEFKELGFRDDLMLFVTKKVTE